MENPFDRWNSIKKQLASDPSRPPAFPKSGEVWMCTLGKNLGREQDGGSRDFSRPVLPFSKSVVHGAPFYDEHPHPLWRTRSIGGTTSRNNWPAIHLGHRHSQR